MNLTENINISLRAIRSNWLRSMFTLLMIAFGIAALVGILTSLDILLNTLSSNFSDMGANSFDIIRKGDGISGNRRGRRQKRGDVISFKEATKFKERYDFDGVVSVSCFGTSLATIKYKNEKTNPNVSVVGGDENYLKIRGLELEHGRNFSGTEVENGANRIIIGSGIVTLLFDGKGESALGKTVSNGNVKYKVIGVLKSKGASMTSNEDKSTVIPLNNAKRYYDTPNKNYNVSVQVMDATQMEDAIAEATGVMRNVRKLKAGVENDFEVQKSDGLMDVLKENTFTIRLSIIIIGLVILSGAAIGLMNIMLVSVTERTKEIGISKAIGATKANILSQFLTEAIVVSLLGGITGIILGIIAGNVVAYLLDGGFIIPWMWIGVGVLLCLFVGILSGSIPAYKAAQLDPIESLRYE